MRIWQKSLKQFIGDYPIFDNDPPGQYSLTLEEKKRYLKQEILHDGKKWLRPTLTHIDNCFYYAKLYNNETGKNSDIVCLRKSKDGDFFIVGGYIGPSLWISENHLQKGLGKRLVIEKYYAAEEFFKPISYTVLGYKTHVAAYVHELNVAYKKGYNICRSDIHLIQK